ncbi:MULTISPECIES: hypothetical protein [unclassified Kitasatospora]|uniref:hypothetical protein n=1 Tax=unclassified Kitasatospora TaxID=2633591 RepID=UPI0024753740|nr:hypothetical protein [Kitasatospora sp. MAP12-44]
MIAAISALAGARIGRAGGREAAQLVATATRDQRRYDDQRAICADLIAATDAELALLWQQESGTDTGSAQNLEAAELFLPRFRAQALVRLECPAEVEASADALTKAVGPLYRVQPDPTKRERERMAYNEARDSFILAARKHLDALRP